MGKPIIKTCEFCEGTGKSSDVPEDPQYGPISCRSCGGTGEIWEYPKTKQAGGAINDSGMIIKETVSSTATTGLDRSGCLIPILFPIDVLIWISQPVDRRKNISKKQIGGLSLLGPLVGYMTAIGPIMVLLLIFEGLSIFSDPYTFSILQLGIYPAIFGALCTIGGFGLSVLLGRGLDSIYQTVIVGLKLTLVVGLGSGFFIFFVAMNPN